MKYKTPGLTILGKATEVIQDFTKSSGPMEPLVLKQQLNPAYDLDE